MVGYANERYTKTLTCVYSKGGPASDKHIDLELAAMTPEQWKEEFRKELDALREPIERLDALIKLYPYKGSCHSAIRESFTALAMDFGIQSKLPVMEGV